MCSLSDSWDLARLVRLKDAPGANSGAFRNQGECKLTEEQVLNMLECVCEYIREEREYYLSIGKPLDSEHVAVVRPFFSPTLLAGIKVVQLEGQRIKVPSDRQEIGALDFRGFREFTHMASMTFEEVLVFNDKITERLLFHALVRSVQFQVLGLARYVELFFRVFLDTGWRFNVPLEGHAFELESKFVENRETPFSVEEEVRTRVIQNRYESL
jgi:hypothetical protein